MLNQLVGLIVGCILFFRGITFFVNKTFAGIEHMQETKDQYFSTQTVNRCDEYLAQDARKYLPLQPSEKIPGSCFRNHVTIPTDLPIRQKGYVIYRRYMTKQNK